MSPEVIVRAAIVSIIIWIIMSKELVKPSKEQNGKLIALLIYAGCLSTIILMVPLYQNLPF
ncbi:hypothetical protein [Oceanobacillus sp. FSL K6-3682]|uniref:hypothetical protein n=1 Tax=Oceanobacillus sp. FSL K6-3682 TaxID=2921503 RepID=UPI000A547365